MVKYDYAEKVVNVVRKILTAQPYRDCVISAPKIVLDGSSFELKELRFDNWGTVIVVNNNGIYYKKLNSSSYIVLLKYDGFDALLSY